MAPTEHPRIPDLIEVVRDRHGRTHVIIDDVPLPYAIDARGAVALDVHPGRPPAVTLTLVAASVHLRDDLFVGVDLNAVAHQPE